MNFDKEVIDVIRKHFPNLNQLQMEEIIEVYKKYIENQSNGKNKLLKLDNTLIEEFDVKSIIDVIETSINDKKNIRPIVSNKKQNKKKNLIYFIIIFFGLTTIISSIFLYSNRVNQIEFSSPNVLIFYNGVTYENDLKLGQIYGTEISFDLENISNEVMTIQITINLKYVGLLENGTFTGLTFSSFQSDGSGENTTVILTYDIEPNSFTSKVISFSFYPTAVTNNFKISIIPNNSNDVFEYLGKVVVGLG
jgi:hypothetical protein